MSDAAGQALANAPVSLRIVNGPNAGKSFSGVTDAAGNATLQYSSSAQGTDLLQAVAPNISGRTLSSQQTSTTLASAGSCPAPATAQLPGTPPHFLRRTAGTL